MKTKHILIAILLAGFGPIGFAQDVPSSDQMRNATRAEAREQRQEAIQERRVNARLKRQNREVVRVKDVQSKPAQ